MRIDLSISFDAPYLEAVFSSTYASQILLATVCVIALAVVGVVAVAALVMSYKSSDAERKETPTPRGDTLKLTYRRGRSDFSARNFPAPQSAWAGTARRMASSTAAG